MSNLRGRKIAVVGRGNVASHMHRGFEAAGADVVMINSRTLEGLPSDAALYVISVSDDAIPYVAAMIDERLAGAPDAIVVHTSGSTPIDALAAFQHRGVIYPLQTFSRDVAIDWARVPLFLETADEADLSLLKEAAGMLSSKLQYADSHRRMKMHLAAVFACNFANRMWAIADRLLQEEGLSLSIVEPLIEETRRKIGECTPREAQTGPARRGDDAVLARQEEALIDPALREIYHIISDNIKREYKYALQIT